MYASLSVYNSKDGSAIGHMMYPRKAPSGAATTGSTLYVPCEKVQAVGHRLTAFGDSESRLDDIRLQLLSAAMVKRLA